MNHQSPLPRFPLPNEEPLDPFDVAATLQRPAVSVHEPMRPRADSTQDVALDQILFEAFLEPPPETLRMLPAVDELPHPGDLDQMTPSVAPVAMSIAPPEVARGLASELARERPPRRGRGAIRVAAALFAVFALAAVGGFFAPGSRGSLARFASRQMQKLHLAASPGAPPARAAAPAVPPTPPTPVASTAPTATVATMSVDALPKATTEPSMTLVTLPPYAAGHRLFVDGAALVEASSPVPIKCGRHAVKIGSAGKTRELDLPCGGELVLR